MSVKLILEAKGRDVATIGPDQTMADAVKSLSERRIGALVVTGPDGAVLGMLSERDVVRLVAGEGADGLRRTVSTRMTAKVVTGSEDMAIDEAMGLMTKGRFRHLPICSREGRLVGIISIGDAVKRRLDDAVQEAEDMRSYIHAG